MIGNDQQRPIILHGAVDLDPDADRKKGRLVPEARQARAPWMPESQQETMHWKKKKAGQNEKADPKPDPDIGDHRIRICLRAARVCRRVQADGRRV